MVVAQRKTKVNGKKLLQKTFKVYDDEIVITYTFTDDVDRPKRTKETTVRTEKQIELAENSASYYTVSSSIFSHCPPKDKSSKVQALELLLFN